MIMFVLLVSRLGTIVTNYGEGLQNERGGGHGKFYPYEKWEGGGNSFSHAEGGGGTKSFGAVFMR